MADSKHEPDDDEDEDGDDLPVKLPAKSKPVPVKFSQAAVDYSVNAHLRALVPAEANEVVFSVRAVSKDGKEKILTGVVAGRVDAGKFDIGAAIGAQLDLENRDNWSVEFLGVVSWK